MNGDATGRLVVSRWPWVDELAEKSFDDLSVDEWRRINEAQKEWQRTGGRGGPYFRWEALRELALLKELYYAGEAAAMPAAIALCADKDVELPRWVSQAFLRCQRAVVSHHAASWDELLGEPRPKGEKRRRAAAHFRQNVGRIAVDIREAQREGVPIDDHLFAEIGRKRGIGGKTTVKRAYAFAKRLIAESVLEYLPLSAWPDDAAKSR